MAFDGAMKMMGGRGKMMGKPEPKEGKVEGEHQEGEEKTHTITEHGDGSMTSKMHDGAEEHHPDHLHMLAHLGHQVTGGDKHHIAHHDGMAVHAHGIHESGEHMEGPHGSAEEAGQHLTQMMGDGDEQQQEEPQHMMGGYGG